MALLRWTEGTLEKARLWVVAVDIRKKVVSSKCSARQRLITNVRDRLCCLILRANPRKKEGFAKDWW